MKYIIDLEPFTFDEDTFPVLWQAQGFRTLFFDNYGVGKLTPLSDDSCIKQLQQSGWMHQREKEIYEHGYTNGLDALKYTDGGELYAKGQNSAWKAALEIVTPDNMGGKYTSNELRTIFGVDFDYECLRKYTAAEVIRMLEDYEKKKEAVQAICVGDEVKFCHNSPDMEPLVVTALMPNSDKDLLCITVRGKYIAVQSKQVVKTGRHFDQVAELMNAMRGNDE